MLQQKDKRSFGDIAHMSALKPEEMEEARLEAEANNSEEGGMTDSMSENGVNSRYGYIGSKRDDEAAKVIRMEHEAPVYTVTPKPDQKMMFGFLLYHTYLNPMGMIALLIGIAAVVMVIVSMVNGTGGAQLLLFGIVALVFVLNSPVTLVFKAKKYAEQTADPENAITYTFSSTGFDLSRTNGDYAAYEWVTFAKIKETQDALFCYLAKNQAFVIPKRDLGADLDGFKQLVSSKVDEKKLKLIKNEL